MEAFNYSRVETQGVLLWINFWSLKDWYEMKPNKWIERVNGAKYHKKTMGLLLVGTHFTLAEVETWGNEYVFCWSVLTSQSLGCLWPWKGARQPRGSRLLMLQADRSDGLLHNLHTCKTIHSILKTTHYFKNQILCNSHDIKNDQRSRWNIAGNL